MMSAMAQRPESGPGIESFACTPASATARLCRLRTFVALAEFTCKLASRDPSTDHAV